MSGRAALHVVERRGAGDGPATVLVLHGFTGSGAAMAPLWERLRDRYTVLAPDLLGHGRSPAPLDLSEYTTQAAVRQLAEVLDRHRTASAHVVGYSMGGRLALALACAAPERVASVAVVGASAGIPDDRERTERRRRDKALADRIEADGIEAFVDHWMELPLFASQQRLGADHLDRMRTQRLDNRPVGLAMSLRGSGTGAQPPLHDDLARSSVPFLFVAGAEDAKFAALARQLAGIAPVGSVATIEGAGHAAHLEQPDAVVAAVSAHFASAAP